MNDWGGMTGAIIGYYGDGKQHHRMMFTPIVADFYDTTDHNQDGYVFTPQNVFIIIGQWLISFQRIHHEQRKEISCALLLAEFESVNEGKLCAWICGRTLDTSVKGCCPARHTAG